MADSVYHLANSKLCLLSHADAYQDRGGWPLAYPDSRPGSAAMYPEVGNTGNQDPLPSSWVWWNLCWCCTLDVNLTSIRG